MNIIEELQARESFFQASTTIENLEAYLNSGQRTVYLGLDPTADSLHIGHLATMVVIKRFLNAGHRAIIVIGGATGMIGDPSGKNEERNLLDHATLQKNVAGLTAQCESFFGKDDDWQMVNNYDWTHKLDVITFLRDIGKNFSVNVMLKKDSVASRLNTEDSFFSYTEFSYSLLQAYDFLHLFENNGCTIQIGASDQWGNMVAGVELIHKKLGAEAFVITAPLVVDSKTGKKFGKSEKGAIWLDQNKTNSYEVYQFLLNTPDADAVHFLKRFTFLSLDEIANIENEFNNNPGLRLAQKTLAFEVVKNLHGTGQANIAVELSDKLFANDVSNLTDNEFEMLASVLPQTSETNIIEALVATNLASSKREAKEFIENGAVSVSGVVVTDPTYTIPQTPTIIKKGKKDYGIVI
ncbi:tyrosine--tRNA ligase [Candidatus Nomurabacteria bacterium RIFCSPHIGHO2_02_FULL_38_15]|uniref:Tyrosine--tRNA ligase n=1 Tax=Candidatus Nomurabacteria bacterium RIFCSPHIGHO2_02_FULL_38_15 TaxID=1801752 RepID=A0A1F6VPY9_9BACT|nr:MAG: tyrosine--tRNA ligase [Candidatus Nomurabacteria bacterium RIFCSPHIGHO2_02_FULL_38_15]